uniref:Uncharacterized protein n=1 Tax=Rhizophora mucronata TaxID=61149 RepID=A0A2P2NMZ1_RHIMU
MARVEICRRKWRLGGEAVIREMLLEKKTKQWPAQIKERMG